MLSRGRSLRSFSLSSKYEGNIALNKCLQCICRHPQSTTLTDVIFPKFGELENCEQVNRELNIYPLYYWLTMSVSNVYVVYGLGRTCNALMQITYGVRVVQSSRRFFVRIFILGLHAQLRSQYTVSFYSFMQNTLLPIISHIY